MIWLDVTKSARAAHSSGLTRVTSRLAEEFGPAATPCRWPQLPVFAPGDSYLTAEVFAPAERPGFEAFLRARTVPTAAIFHDAIPLRLPRLSWPQAVARHPAYMTMLAGFERVWAVSRASAAELEGFWRWQNRGGPLPRVEVLPLGSDFAPGTQPTDPADSAQERPPLLLQVGIVEPRKGQDFLLELALELWAEGAAFNLECVGRVNPHFGKPIADRLRAARSPTGRPVYLGAIGDHALRHRYAAAAACVLPTIAEGCGLPLLEAAGCGVPCFASDLPALRENAGPGTVLLPERDRNAWKSALREFVGDADARDRRRAEVRGRRSCLPRWADTAARISRKS